MRAETDKMALTTTAAAQVSFLPPTQTSVAMAETTYNIVRLFFGSLRFALPSCSDGLTERLSPTRRP